MGKLLAFLRETECEQLYIVGDFIDGWQLRRKRYWTEEYNFSCKSCCAKTASKREVTFIIGNHDEFLEQYPGLELSALSNWPSARSISRALTASVTSFCTAINSMASPILIACSIALAPRLYERILDMNIWVNRVRRLLGFWLLVFRVLHQTESQARR